MSIDSVDKICANCKFFKKAENAPPGGSCSFKLPTINIPYYSEQTDYCDLWQVKSKERGT